MQLAKRFTFPRPSGRGLIEAKRFPPYGKLSIQISAAVRSRPH